MEEARSTGSRDLEQRENGKRKAAGGPGAEDGRTGAERTRRSRRGRTQDVALCGLFVAVLTVCSWISIPLTVPVTLQTFAVFVCAGLLGTKRSLAAVLCWILMGFAGVPVFSGFKGGPQVIFGPTGGYIVGFVITVLIVGIVCEKLSRHPAVMGAAMVAGLLVCYVFGTFWFMYFYGKTTGPIGFGATLGICVIPFIVPDMIKIAVALFLTKKLERHVPQRAGRPRA